MNHLPGRRAVAIIGLLLMGACGSDSEDQQSNGPHPADPSFNTVITQSNLAKCSADDLGSSAETDFTAAYEVVDGALGQVCFGQSDPRLLDAWDALATIAPALQLADLALFGGFVSGETDDELTLAFVNALDDDGTAFQMSINLDTYEEDGDEALLTMAHEFSHVFTATPEQLDHSSEAFENCDTYFSGEGCYWPESLMFRWIEEFWDEDLLFEVDPNAEASGADGQERCDLDPSFFGSYAASNPEEDFAESFGAMVFRVEAQSAEQQKKLDWLADQPGLVEFRDRATEAEFGPLQNNFDPCGR